ncbi:MAG: chalcone isomerase family protein [Deltaproteobacteria bacterium]|nr:chalcone isomerase family protein [Deltaproteobacteria bacterium]
MSLKILGMTFISLMLTVSSSNAELLTKEFSGKEMYGVKLSKSASAKVDQLNVDLVQVGAGLRTKKVLVANIKVYTAELFVSEPLAVVKSDADILETVSKVRAAAVQLTFLRSVEAEKVQVSFREALVANEVDINSPEINQLFSFLAAGGEAKEKKTMTFLTIKNADGTETLSFEDTNGSVGMVKGNNLSKSIFSMWLGIPADDGLIKLKAELLN